MSDLNADGIHKEFTCWDCDIKMLIISESQEHVKYCPYCNAELDDNYDITDDAMDINFDDVDEVTVDSTYEDLPWDKRL